MLHLAPRPSLVAGLRRATAPHAAAPLRASTLGPASAARLFSSSASVEAKKKVLAVLYPGGEHAK